MTQFTNHQLGNDLFVINDRRHNGRQRNVERSLWIVHILDKHLEAQAQRIQIDRRRRLEASLEGVNVALLALLQ